MVKDRIRRIVRYVTPVLLWIAVAILIGILGGLVGTAFHKSIEEVTWVRERYGWMIWLLPLGGLAIAGLYQLCRVDLSVGTNDIIDCIRTEKEPPLLLVPLIFVGTVITHLFGGSSGREGAALQLGGVIGHSVGKVFHLKQKDVRLAIMCGMSAVFAALFGTPLTATVFAMEVISVGVIYYAALIPCLTAALVANFLAQLAGIKPTQFMIPSLPAETPLTIVRVFALAVFCSFLSIVFCISMHQSNRLLSKAFPNAYLRLAVCGLAVAGLTFLLGTQDYNGTGMTVIQQAISGSARPEAFLLKIVFTALTIGAGYKGGEIVPTFFIGAAFGCVAGALLGLPAGFGAAIGICAMFCGTVNCPVASVFLAIELFGGVRIPLFFIAACVSYGFSGYYGLYGSQKILYSKYKLEFVNRMAK